MDLMDAPRPTSPRSRQRRSTGRRSAQMALREQAQQRERRARRTRQAGIGVLVLVVLAGLVAGVAGLVGGVGEDEQSGTAEAPGGAAVAQSTLLLVREDQAVRGAVGLTLLATAGGGQPSATFIPSTTLVEIPGVGLDRVGLAQQYGGASLTAAAIENAMGIRIDHVATVTTEGLGALLQRAGGAELTIAERLVDRAADGTGTVAFEAGEQYLNGLRLAEYWGFEQRGETEMDTFPRQQRALGAVLRALDDDVLRETLFAQVPTEIDTDADADFLRTVLGELASAAAADAMVFQLLPVGAFGSADATLGASYQVREDELVELVGATLSGAVPEGGGAQVPRVQVLNGVGEPGIGQQVDERIGDLGLRIALTENARSFDFPETQIVIYEETAAMLRSARQVQEAMGVGTILVSRQPQSVVDMTIVVGADFIGRRTEGVSGV